MVTSWLERWRLATSIPPAMAGGGSDPCRGSTAKIPQRKNPDIPSFAFSSLPRFIRDDSSGAPPPSILECHPCARPSETEASVGSIIHGETARNLSSKVPFLREYSAATRNCSDQVETWPRRGYPCCVAVAVAVGNIARPPSQEAQTSTNTPSTPQDNSSHHPSGN